MTSHGHLRTNRTTALSTTILHSICAFHNFVHVKILRLVLFNNYESYYNKFVIIYLELLTYDKILDKQEIGNYLGQIIPLVLDKAIIFDVTTSFSRSR